MYPVPDCVHPSDTQGRNRLKQSETYATRFQKVFEYIDGHLDEPISLSQLSSVANFSVFHFHRQFTVYTGVPVLRYVQLMRLRRASYLLAFNRKKRVVDVALGVGFEAPESFARAFRNTFGQSPSAFREQPDWREWHAKFTFRPMETIQPMDIEIVHNDAIRVAVLEHHGHPDLVSNTVARFIDWRKTSGLSPIQSSKTFGIIYNDPETVTPEEFRYDVCGSITADTPDVPDNPQGVRNGWIPAGRCARVRHHGSHTKLGPVVQHLYREWLLHSGEELRDFPVYFHFLNLLSSTPEHALETDVYLPLK